MSIFKSGNPTLTEKRFKDTILEETIAGSDKMTIRGTVNKFGLLFLLMLSTTFYAWKEFDNSGDVFTLMMIGAFGGLAIAVTLYFKTEWSPWLAPVYALVKGLLVGSVSASYNQAFDKFAPSIIMVAVTLTISVALAMYLLYSFRIIRATQRFRAIITTATLGIALFYLIAFTLSFFSINIPFLHEGSTIGIVFSFIVVGLAALNLILDFDMIETGSQMGAPKYMEWYGAFGLLVTIIWLYFEILRLLSKLNRR
jgi:uncharacterized YccA/Bax inhibitor family protein